MSIVTLLARQSLIARKNYLQTQMLQNSALRRGMLDNISFGGGYNLAEISARETAMDLENISASSELMAINAELSALSNYSSDNKMNFLA